VINVSISTIVAGSLAICALSTCDSNDKDVYSRYGLDNPKNPKNVVELAADYQTEIKSLEESLTYKSREIKRLKNVNNDLSEEVKNLKKELGEVKKEEAKTDGRYVNTVSNGNRSSSNNGSVDNSAKRVDKTFEATFYTAFCPTGCTGVTATGVDVSKSIYHEGKRIIAVDPNVIPLGSHVRVTLADGTSFEATAQDVGGDIRGDRIDILVKTREEAYRLGRQKVRVEVY